MTSKHKGLAEYLENAGFSQISAGAGSAEYQRGELVVSLLTDNSGAWDIVHSSDYSVSIASGHGLSTLRTHISGGK